MTDDLLVAARAVDDDIHIQRQAFMLLAALEVGTSIKALRARTRVPWSALNNGSWYLRRDRVWVGQTMHYAWLDRFLDGYEQEGMIGLTLDAMVGAGILRRQGAGLDVAYRLRYFMEDLDPIEAEESGLLHIDIMRRYRRPQKHQNVALGEIHPRTGQPKRAVRPLTDPEPEYGVYRADICGTCGWLISDHSSYFEHRTPLKPVIESSFSRGFHWGKRKTV